MEYTRLMQYLDLYLGPCAVWNLAAHQVLQLPELWESSDSTLLRGGLEPGRRMGN